MRHLCSYLLNIFLGLYYWLEFPDLWSGQNPDGTDINPCGEFRWSPEGPVSQIHYPHLLSGAPGIFSDLLRSLQMVKTKWGAKNNRKLPHLFIPSKTATMVPEFAVEDLPLGRNAALVPEFTVNDLPLGRTLWWWWWWLLLNPLQPTKNSYGV